MSPSQLSGFAREVAKATAEGYSFDQIRSHFDLSATELDELFTSEEFRQELDKLGPAVVSAWEEERAASKNMSVRRKASERADAYFEELDRLAFNPALKLEKRADILLKLMDRAAPPEEETEKLVRMPPSLIENLIRRDREWNERHPEEGQSLGGSERERAPEEDPAAG